MYSIVFVSLLKCAYPIVVFLLFMTTVSSLIIIGSLVSIFLLRNYINYVCFDNVDENINVVIVEDIITTGGSVKELIELLTKYNVTIKGIICIVNRSEINIDFGYPFINLLNLPSQSWKSNDCPQCSKGVSLSKPGSTGK